MASSSGRKRLLVLSSTFPARQGDGVPSFVLDLAREEARSFDTTVLVPRVRGAPRQEGIDGVRVLRFPYFPHRWEDLADGAILENLRARPSRALQVPALLAAEFGAVARLVRRWRPDVIHAHWLVPQGLVARLAARRVPLLVTVHGGDLYGLTGAVAHRLQAFALRGADRVAVVNAEMRDRITAMGIPSDRLEIVPMGVDSALFEQLAPREREPRRIVFVGRLVEKKGVHVLLRALARVGGEWELDVLGGGPELPRLQESSRDLRGRVTFHGTVSRSEVGARLASAGVVALPSIVASSGDQDGLPVTLLEAMASGSAVVASRLPGLEEVVEDGRTGLLVPPGDVGALASALDRLLSSPETQQRLGEAARAESEKYTVSHLGRRYTTLLQGISVR